MKTFLLLFIFSLIHQSAEAADTKQAKQLLDKLDHIISTSGCLTESRSIRLVTNSCGSAIKSLKSPLSSFKKIIVQAEAEEKLRIEEYYECEDRSQDDFGTWEDQTPWNMLQRISIIQQGIKKYTTAPTVAEQFYFSVNVDTAQEIVLEIKEELRSLRSDLNMHIKNKN